MDLKFYLSLFFRRLPYFLVVAALVGAIGVTLAAVLPPSYVAKARLLVEGEQIPDNLAASTVRTGTSEQIQIIEQRLTTRANLVDTANRLGLYKGTPPVAADTIVEDMRKRLKISYSGPAPRGPSQATTVTVSFEARSPSQAALVANEVVTQIQQQNREIRTGAAGQTVDFFKQEVTKLDAALAQQSAAILAFKEKNQKALPDSLDYRRARQSALQEQVAQLGRDEATLKDRRARLVDLYERTGRIDAPTDGRTPEQKRLQEMQQQLSNSLIVYSTENPKVKLLQAQIAAMQKVVSDQLAAATPGAETLSPYEIQLADIDGQLGYITEQRRTLEDQIADLDATIQATPGNAIALDTLNRDYSNTRAQYDTAVQAKARADTGDQIETLSRGQRISVIEQAVPPPAPTSPNRPVIAAMGLGGGIGLGLALVFVLEFLNRAVRRPVEIVNRLGITPFATLPYMRTARETRWRRLVILAALSVAVIGVPSALYLFNAYVMPLDLMIDKLVERFGLDTFVEQIRQGLGS